MLGAKGIMKANKLKVVVDKVLMWLHRCDITVKLVLYYST